MIVGIEQHKRLRELGFPMVESCKDVTTGQDVIYKFPMPYNEVEMRLPKLRGNITVSEAIDWIRAEKNIDCAVNLVLTKCYEGVKILYGEFSSGLLLEVLTSQYESYPLAESALLDELLTYLEENNHGNK